MMSTAKVSTRLNAGQALASTTPILTTQGWKTLEQIVPGDQVYTPNGQPTEVTGVTGPWKTRPCYEMLLSNGDIIIADANHEWVVIRNLNQAQPLKLTTKEISEELEETEVNIFIRNTEPVQMPQENISALPNMAENAIKHEHSKQANSYHTQEPHNTYLAEVTPYLDIETREEVIEEFTNPMHHLFSLENQCYKGEISKPLAKQLTEISHTLGIKTTEEETGNSKTVKLIIYPKIEETDVDDQLHHANNYTEILSAINTETTQTLCIQIADKDHMYLAGKSLTPTHTSQRTNRKK